MRAELEIHSLSAYNRHGYGYGYIMIRIQVNKKKQDVSESNMLRYYQIYRPILKSSYSQLSTSPGGYRYTPESAGIPHTEYSDSAGTHSPHSSIASHIRGSSYNSAAPGEAAPLLDSYW